MLTNDNKCYVIGRKEYGRLGLGDVSEDVTELTPIPQLEKIKIIDVECGDNNSFAISEDGKVYVWGMGSSSQLGTGEEDDVLEPKLLTSAQVKDKKVLKVSGGGQHTLFIVEAPEEKTKEEKPKKKEAQEPVSSTTNEAAADVEMKEPEPPADPVKGKGRKGKSVKTNGVEKKNGDAEEKPAEEKTEAPEADEVKETASEAGSSTTDDKGSDKSGKRGRKRKA